MNGKYETGVRFNHSFRILETLSFVGEGVGAALFIVSMITRQPALAALGISFVFVAVVALRMHLGQPTRGWRAVTRLSTSWISRGALAIGGFLGLGTMSVVAAYTGAKANLVWMLTLAALVCAVPVLLYAGVLLHSIRAIRLWGGGWLPVAFPIHSAATSLTISVALMPWLSGGVNGAPWLISAATLCLLMCPAVSAAHILGVQSSAGTHASLDRLIKGDLRFQFLGAAGIFGVVLPIGGLAALESLRSTQNAAGLAWMFAAIALSRLYGDFAYRHSIVMAGAFEPIMPQQSNRIALSVPK